MPEKISKNKKLYEIAFLYLACVGYKTRNKWLADYVHNYNSQIVTDNDYDMSHNKELLCIDEVMEVVVGFNSSLRAHRLEAQIDFKFDDSIEDEEDTPLYIYKCQCCYVSNYESLYVKDHVDIDDDEYSTQFVNHNGHCMYCGTLNAEQLRPYFPEKWVNEIKSISNDKLSRFDILGI